MGYFYYVGSMSVNFLIPIGKRIFNCQLKPYSSCTSQRASPRFCRSSVLRSCKLLCWSSFRFRQRTQRDRLVFRLGSFLLPIIDHFCGTIPGDHVVPRLYSFLFSPIYRLSNASGSVCYLWIWLADRLCNFSLPLPNHFPRTTLEGRLFFSLSIFVFLLIDLFHGTTQQYR